MKLRPLLSVQRALWAGAIIALWERRHAVAIVTVLLWVPWKLFVTILEHGLGLRAAIGFPLEWLVDPFFEPFYGAAMLVLLAAEPGLEWRRALGRATWLLPRFLLIDIKIAVWGIALPYLVLHFGSAVFLTIWPEQPMATTVILATAVSLGWVLLVMIVFILAPAVLVAEKHAEGWDLGDRHPVRTARIWNTGISTEWTLWAAHRLVRGRLPHALAVVVLGQTAVALVRTLVPPGDHPLIRVADGLMMGAMAIWWALLWEFLGWCIADVSPGEPAVRQDGSAVPNGVSSPSEAPRQPLPR